MALSAHCVTLTVNAVKLAWESRSRSMPTADKLAQAVSLDMTGYWLPTVRTYLGRITKAGISARSEQKRRAATHASSRFDFLLFRNPCSRSQTPRARHRR